MSIATFQDVVDQILPVAPSLTSDDIRDLLLVLGEDPSAGPAILDAYKAADATIPEAFWQRVWDVLQEASTVAGVMTSIGGAVTMAGSL